MILRRYRISCPLCTNAAVVVRDVPSQRSINNYLPSDARKPIPPGDRWRLSAEAACPGCSASAEAISDKITAAGLPADHEDLG